MSMTPGSNPSSVNSDTSIKPSSVSQTLTPSNPSLELDSLPTALILAKMMTLAASMDKSQASISQGSDRIKEEITNDVDRRIADLKVNCA